MTLSGKEIRFLSWMTALAVIMLAVGYRVWTVDIPKCQIPEGKFETYRSKEIDRPFEAGVKSLLFIIPCFGQIEKGGTFDRTAEITGVLQEYSYTAFMNARRLSVSVSFGALFLLIGFLFRPKKG